MSRTRAILATAVALTLLALSPPGTARAGSYEVYSCHPDGLAPGWVPSHTAGATAYIECGPSASAAGLRARNVINGLLAPVFTYGQVAITSPPGTYFDWMRFDADLRAQIGWRAGIHDLVRRTWIWCGTSACTSSFGWRSFETPVAGTRSLGVMTICSKLQCGPNTEPWGFLGIRNVRLRVQDPVMPTLKLTAGSLLSGGWLRGTHSVSATATDNAGLKHLRLQIDGRVFAGEGAVCDFHRPAPCAGTITANLRPDLTGISDGAHPVAIVTEDAASNVTTRRATIHVDNTPPDRVSNLEVTPSTWTSAPEFDVTWSNPSRGAGAPITTAYIQLCADGCLPVERFEGADGERATLRAPNPGRWRLRLWVGDGAGNAAPVNSQETDLLADPVPPSVRFGARTEHEPGTLRFAAYDNLSGVASGELELRRHSDSLWHAIPVAPVDGGFAGVVDDEILPAGRYLVRARVTDRAGNEQTVAGDVLELPFRLATELSVGQRKRIRAQGIGGQRFRRVLIRNPAADFGRPIRLRGRLSSPGGNPLPGRDIDVAEMTGDPQVDVWHPIATIRTDDRGRFIFKATPGQSRRLRFRYAGTPTIRGQSSVVRLRVRAASTLTVNRKRVVNGEEVRFKGVVQGVVPPTGKLLQLQVFSRGMWLTFATPRADQRGRWRRDYRFTATRGVTRYRFRVRIPRESGFPYVPGTSRQVGVKVIGT